ncbi:MAG TPA: hypothetical protein VHY32_10410 [Caulobacteraceae bacterium]|jgi:hypothetical protein|nr:hypothetical protein [Caulobacteraceae bacterium]
MGRHDRAGAAARRDAETEEAGGAAARTEADAARTRGPTVLLASTCAWASVPKLAAALAGTPCVVTALAPTKHLLHLTSAVTRRFRYRATRPLVSLAEAIAKARPDLIVACDERAVGHLQRLHARTADTELRALIERSLGRPDGYRPALSRLAVTALAASLGVNVPATAVVRSRADLRDWAPAHPLPWVIKTDGSWGGMGVRVVHSVAEAERAFAALSRPFNLFHALRRLLLDGDAFWLTPWLHLPSRQVTVQTFILGRPANCAIAAWEGETLSGVAVEVVAGSGETGPAAVVRQAVDPQMLEAGASLVRALGLSGLVGFDFIIEASTGRAFLLELNARATPIGHLRLGSGRDLVGALIARLAGRPQPDWPAETVCDTIALFPQAVLSFKDHPILANAYHDVPVGEPRLVRALLRSRSRRRRPPLFIAVAPAE